MISHRLGRTAAAIVSTALVVVGAAAAPAHAAGVKPAGITPACTPVYDTGVVPPTETYTDSGDYPTVRSMSLSKSAVVIGATSVSIGITVILGDDCFGSDAVRVRLHSSTGATKVVSLVWDDSYDAVDANDYVLERWVANPRFSNLDRGSWYLDEVLVAGYSGSIVFNKDTGDLITDGFVAGPEVKQVVAAKKLNVFAATRSAVNAAPEPISKGRTLTVYAASQRIYGKSWVANKYASVTIQYKAPGQRSWKTLKTSTTDRFGRASASVKASAKGNWAFRTLTAGRIGYASSASSVDWVTVK